MERNKKIIQTSIIGIIGNVILVIFKMAVGLFSHSIAVILDAVNNLTDALSSVITIVGTRLAGKKPDKKHPYGYGRVEYLTSLVIGVLILIAGITFIRESIDKIIHPADTDYSVLSIVIIAAAILVKLAMGIYTKKIGKKLNSGALVGSGSDALMDAIVSAATLVSAILNMIFGLKIEGYLGAVISVLIIKSGIEALMESVHTLIGNHQERETSNIIKKLVREVPGVLGAYDVTLHSYGENFTMGTVHVEVSDVTDAVTFHKLTHTITEKVYNELGIPLTVGLYASNNTDEKNQEIRQHVHAITKKYPGILSMHGFFREEKFVSFDLVMDFKVDADQIRNEVISELRKIYPEYTFMISIDINFSD